jgi:DNA-binding protein HU-beta
MNKSELIAAIAADSTCSWANVAIVLDSLAKVVTDHLAGADPHVDAEVTLPGLGKLKTTTRAARTGRNPATGAPIEIPERVALKFAPAKSLDDRLNP